MNRIISRLALWSVVGICFVLSACHKDPVAMICGVSDPAVELEWLAQEIRKREADPSHYQNTAISLAQYEGQMVFTYDICCPNCNYFVPVYNCEGVQIMDADITKVHFEKVLWTPMDYGCSTM